MQRAPDLHAVQLRAPRYRVSRRAIAFWAARAAGAWLAVLAAEMMILLVGWHDMAGRPGLVLAATAAVALAHLAIMPIWRYRVHRWEVTDVAVYTQAGWFNQERRIAPVSRIQTVDIHRGPLQQLFRLANVTVTTASAAGPLHIHGLPRDSAESIVDRLTARVDATADDAT